MGGGTGLIGDPSGKSAERQLMTSDMVESNVASQRRIFEGVFANAPLMDQAADGRAWDPPLILNNADWLTKLSYVEVLRDVGKHFSVNMMIQKESVKERLTGREQGISYTEFSYMILQSFDFAHLHREMGVTVQMGGSDQWGNIVAGADLIRRQSAKATLTGDFQPVVATSGDLTDPATRAHAAKHGVTQVIAQPEAFGLTAPLVTKADGGKFGKTESGAVWLTADRTSPYAMFQFWLNALDDDVERFLKLFTLLPKERIDELMQEHASNPGARAAHRELARNATAIVYGQAEAEQAESAAKALFTGDVASLPEGVLREVFAEAPSSEHDKGLLAGEGLALVDLLVETTLAKSKREAREFVGNGSVSVNGEKAAPDRRVTTADLLHGTAIALRRGKKAWHVTRWG
jgi:tyrosyl-tRNA synthetase